MNSDYLSFKCYHHNVSSAPINVDEIFGESLFNKCDKFEYILGTQENSKGLYFISNDGSEFDGNINIDTDLISKDAKFTIGKPDSSKSFKIYDNNGDDINNTNKSKMIELYIRLIGSDNRDSVVFEIVQNLNNFNSEGVEI